MLQFEPIPAVEQRIMETLQFSPLSNWPRVARELLWPSVSLITLQRPVFCTASHPVRQGIAHKETAEAGREIRGTYSLRNLYNDLTHDIRGD